MMKLTTPHLQLGGLGFVGRFAPVGRFALVGRFASASASPSRSGEGGGGGGGGASVAAAVVVGNGRIHRPQQRRRIIMARHRCSSSAAPSDGRVHIVDAILEDHREIKTYFKEYKESKNMEDKVKWSNQWRWEVARHSIGEELVAYPAMEAYVSGRAAIADKDRAQHRVVKENLAQLQNMEPWKDNSSSFDHLMEKTQQALQNHMKEEEDEDLPKLRNALPDEEGLRLGSKFQLTKHFVPTRSHPSAPDKPPFETVMGLLAAPLDKLRDMFDKFPSEEELSYAKANN